MNGLERQLAERVNAFDALTREELLTEWVNWHGLQPYKGIRKSSLIRGIIYQEQAKALGGLKRSTSRKLLKIATGGKAYFANTSNADSRGTPRTQMGARLVREWNGRTYEVVVADEGYILNGITHRSLSACAKAITGAHWSGPRFFGVAS